MKLVGVSLVGITGGIIFGTLGSLPLLDSAPAEIWKRPADNPGSSIDCERNAGCQIDRATRSPDEGSTSAPQDEHSELRVAETTLRQKIDLLEQGKSFLNRTPDYTATLHKREVVRNELLDEQTILLKCRHAPFSLYLKWVTGDPGREVIFIEGQNDSKIIAHDGGWKQRIPAFYLSPDCPLAMRDARYPATTAGFLGLMEIMLGIHHDDLRQSNLASCELDTSRQFDGRQCDTFTTTYSSPADSPIYRKSITMIDREWRVPLHTQHFEWPKSEAGLTDEQLDEATLIESYSFTEIDFQSDLTDRDFDRTNAEYRFR